ncbi:MAG: flagellar biosynthesis protein FliQ [Gammaproteobacteria bacterium]|nr:flagellar biosynthesis protein FliQ [Gammaproteobacteria bacterium]MDH5802645.1 flagellar biosynthesis protein FliQ [Gammaproteobacteria bacterium]
MTPEFVITLAQQAVKLALILTSTILLPALAVGLIVSMFQAATQINEQTLSFIPKLMITFITLIIAGPWMLQLVVEFSRGMIDSIPGVLG